MTSPQKATPRSPLLIALMEHRVSASVRDLDHHRMGGGLAVETDYIIRVDPSCAPRGNDPQFEGFVLSKNYSAFRTFGNQLKKYADAAMTSGVNLPQNAKTVAQYAETVAHLVESQRTQYVGEFSFVSCHQLKFFLFYQMNIMSFSHFYIIRLFQRQSKLHIRQTPRKEAKQHHR